MIKEKVKAIWCDHCNAEKQLRADKCRRVDRVVYGKAIQA